MTEPWWQRRLCAFDLETTGVDLEDSRIVTASVVECGGGLPTKTYSWLVDPGVEIPEGASRVHGITTERARAEGVEPTEMLFGVYELLEAAVNDGRAVIAFNARFDLTLVDREWRRWNITPLDPASYLVVDPSVVDKFLDRYRKGSRRLGDTCEVYRARLESAHDSDSDALAAARLAWAMAARGVVKRGKRTPAAELRQTQAYWDDLKDDLPRLHAAQVGWAAEQADGLADYFRKSGKAAEAASVQREWPVVPFASG